jgi:hypothetical protein
MVGMRPLQEVEIGAADRRQRDADDGVARVEDLGVGHGELGRDVRRRVRVLR